MRLPQIWKRAFLAITLPLAFAACDDDPVAPAELVPPAGLTVTANGATAATITFSSVQGATEYVLQRAAGTAGNFAEIATLSATTYEDSGLEAGTAYRYRVAAVRSGQQSSFSSAVSLTTAVEGPMEATISSNITSNRTLYADTLYTLSGYVRVGNGATLTIEPGTKIVGDYDVIASSLFIERGARIMAEGTAAEPIVFTSSRPEGERRPGDWGGLVLLGNGVINRSSPVILEGTENLDSPVEYSGGSDNSDSSGSLKYVRIEFAGHEVAPNAELNSLTLAAVGSGTVIEHVQVLAGLDDSFEWFGGAVDARYLVSYEAGDDHLDISEGYQGRIQHAIAFQSRQLLPRPGAGSVASDPQGIENDGCSGQNCLDGQDSEPLNLPVIANFTLIGAGSAYTTSGGDMGMNIRRGTGGYYVNGVVARYDRAAISLRDATTQARLADDDLLVSNLVLAENGQAFLPQTGETVQFSVDEEDNDIDLVAGSAASLFNALPTDPSSATQFDWTPAAGSPAATGGLTEFNGKLAERAGSFVTATSYRGAADPNGDKWWEGWTTYADN
ncbi:MAG: fibronectin type III domain-containing protein [Gemmatimonadota bacterium]